MSRIERIGHLLAREMDLCNVFWLAAVKSESTSAYGFDENGAMKPLSIRKGYKNYDCGLDVYWEARDGSKQCSEVMVIGKELNSRGEWVPTGIVRVRGRKSVG